MDWNDLDPGPFVPCAYCDFYEAENLMPPIHDCPAPAPLDYDDPEAPLSDLERELLVSLHEAFGVKSGTIRYLDRRKR